MKFINVLSFNFVIKAEHKKIFTKMIISLRK